MNTDSLVVAQQRHQKILHLATQQEVVRIRELSQNLGVSDMTIRRDLNLLSEQGLLERTHGGARLHAHSQTEVALSQRLSTQTEAKERLARAALGLISDGDTIALDSSTTSLHLAHLLQGRNVHCLVTGLDAANTLSQFSVPFTLVGGTFHATARSFISGLFQDIQARLHPDQVFFSCLGYSSNTGFTDAYLPEVSSKERLLATGKRVIALIDSSKFGRQAMATITRMGSVHTLITDQMPPHDVLVDLDTHQTRLIIAP
ncbi:DeoR/GlpR family DNA-binding transcription regulator [Deinococcus roseus]|uniref:DeoR family transcriptional regulator n=1 Tax=Deinococcus roseus TaxID=392414 RepID=A0ABQ2D2N1_9DEIO|nr:DeoR/GlpR family DNA-binding transcription regulator [Deinococcus roseus]GGJ42595.1 DeoR family transcriptional regulator [Deinococcus roseus]